jgi:hypothetical protein
MLANVVVWVQTQDTSCEILNELNGTRTGIFPKFTFHLIDIISPMLHICLLPVADSTVFTPSFQ